MEYCAYGFIGDNPKDLTLHLYVDADFAGCPYTLRSTSGAHTCIQGPNSRFSWGAGSNQQTSRAQSTPEAELASMNEGMKRRGEQALTIWQWLLEQYHEEGWTASIILHEDNTTAIIGARTAKNPTMKTLERGFGIDIGWNNARILSGDYELIHTSTKHMIADIYTKCMCNVDDWEILRRLVGIFLDTEFYDGDFSPDVLRLAAADSESESAACLKEDILNHHYRMAMSGESTKNSDFRKVVKVKPPKKKDPLKGKIPREAKASKKKKLKMVKANVDKENVEPKGSSNESGPGGANNGYVKSCCAKGSGPSDIQDDQAMNMTQKGKCFALRKGVSRKSEYTTFYTTDNVGLANVHVLDTADDVSPKGASHSYDHGLGENDKYAVILLCTDKDSFIKTYNPYPEHCDIIEITEEDDFTSERGYEKVLKTLKSYKKACLFISMPCVGGCMFNMGINWAKANARKQIKGHWKLFRKLWSQYDRLCKELPFNIPTILEWPRSNAYWKVTKVTERLKKNGMAYTDFDGCQYGLKDKDGIEFLKKPWRFAANGSPRTFQGSRRYSTGFVVENTNMDPLVARMPSIANITLPLWLSLSTRSLLTSFSDLVSTARRRISPLLPPSMRNTS